ncbi:MAG: hypothetical protein ACIAQU_06505 [Phycisphaerales bacterium JB064]
MDEQPDTGRFLREFVSGRDVPCPSCSYNLRDLTSAVCPECGEALALRLQAEHPRVSVLVLGLLPLAMAFGFFTIITLFVIGISIWHDDWPPLGYWVAAPLIGSIFGVMTFAWVKNWTRVRRWSQRGRIAVVSACWITMAIGAVVFLLITMNLP